MNTKTSSGVMGLFFAVSLFAACSDSKSNGSDDASVGDAASGGAGGTSTGGTSGSLDAAVGDTSSSGGSGGVPGTGTGGTNAATTSKAIKAAEGGTITADGLTVTIPPGALQADTEITVGVSTGAGLPGAAALASKAYDLGPNGTMFLKPVTLTIDFDAAKLATTKVATIAFLEAGAWVPLTGTFTNGAKAQTTTTHFTPFAVVSGDPVIANCTGMAGLACSNCCKSTFPGGQAKVIPSIIQTCACAVNAPCNAQCASSLCMGMAMTANCKTCFDAETGKSNSACYDQGLLACSANSDCKSYVTCGASCN